MFTDTSRRQDWASGSKRPDGWARVLGLALLAGTAGCLDFPTADKGGTNKTDAASGTVLKDQWVQLGPYAVLYGAPLVVTMTGTGDADLYVKRGSPPTTSSWDCRPYTNTSNEACAVSGSNADGVYVGVRGYGPTSSFDVSIEWPQPGSGSYSDPIVLRRDNLAAGGEVAVEGTAVKGTVGSDVKFFSQARWTNATARLTVGEYRSNGSGFTAFSTPLLPTKTFQAPGIAHFGTRAINLVHGNIYGVYAYGSGLDVGSHSTATKYVKLADDVHLVPVVVISWRRQSGTFIDQRVPSAGAFDFYPADMGDLSGYWRWENGQGHYVAPYALKSPTLDQNDVNDSNDDTWSSGLSRYRPDQRWMPPDELWAKCGIQFQVVDSITVDLPSGWHSPCSDWGNNTPSPGHALKKKYKDTPLASWAAYIVDHLRPVYVNFADHDCGIQAHWQAVTNGMGGDTIDVDNGADSDSVAHELGHALGLPHVAIDGNLMAGAGPEALGVQGTDLCGSGECGGIDQCHDALTRAINLSARYDEFNRVTGRTFSSEALPDLDQPAQGGTDGSDPDLGDLEGGADEHCCLQQGAAPGEYFDVAISVAGCLAGEPELPLGMCDTGGCSNGDGDVTRYTCEQLGFSYADPIPE